MRDTEKKKKLQYYAKGSDIIIFEWIPNAHTGRHISMNEQLFYHPRKHCI